MGEKKKPGSWNRNWRHNWQEKENLKVRRTKEGMTGRRKKEGLEKEWMNE